MTANKTKKSILITGASGFVGQNIIHLLLKQKPDLEIYNLSAAPIDLPGVKNIVCDVIDFDPSSLKTEFDYIIHLLALSNEKYCEDFDLAEKINISFTKKMLDFAKQQKNLKKFVHMSSITVYSNNNITPVREDGATDLTSNTYLFTKIVSELYAKFYHEKFKLPIIIFRLSNIYGPYQIFDNSPFLIASKIAQAVTEKEITVFNLKPRRDWIYSEDAAEGIVMSLDTSATGIYNLASGYGASVEEVISKIAESLKVPYHSLDKPTSGLLDFYCDISKIKKDIGWVPKTDLAHGIAKTIEFYKNSH